MGTGDCALHEHSACGRDQTGMIYFHAAFVRMHIPFCVRVHVVSSTQQVGCASASLGPFEDIKEHIPRRGPAIFAKVHMRSLVV